MPWSPFHRADTHRVCHQINPKWNCSALLGDLPCISLGTNTPQISAIGKMYKLRRKYLGLFSHKEFCLKGPISKRWRGKHFPICCEILFQKDLHQQSQDTSKYLKLCIMLTKQYRWASLGRLQGSVGADDSQKNAFITQIQLRER